jgi:hypothetical protein
MEVSRAVHGEGAQKPEANDGPCLFLFGLNLSFFVLLGRVQESEGLGPPPGMHFVVDVVRPHDAFHVPAPGHEFDFYPPVHDNVMEDKIKNTVGQHAEANPEQKFEAGYERARREKANGKQGEHDGEIVVFLEKTLVWPVVVFVPDPQNAVHDVLVRKPRHAFHEEKSTYYQQYVKRQCHSLKAVLRSSDPKIGGFVPTFLGCSAVLAVNPPLKNIYGCC